ncbi:hypothetical protein ACTXT7_001893 [Hymenolepis weldensis]
MSGKALQSRANDKFCIKKKSDFCYPVNSQRGSVALWFDASLVDKSIPSNSSLLTSNFTSRKPNSLYPSLISV